MSGVVAAMRRTLLSCTIGTSHGLMALATMALLPAEAAAQANELSFSLISVWSDLNHQDFAVLTTALALVVFLRRRRHSLDARPRSRHPHRMRSAPTSPIFRFRPTMRAFAVRRTAGLGRLGGRRQPAQISGDIALVTSREVARNSHQRDLPLEPGCRRNRRRRWTAVEQPLREGGQGFLLNL